MNSTLSDFSPSGWVTITDSIPFLFFSMRICTGFAFIVEVDCDIIIDFSTSCLYTSLLLFGLFSDNFFRSFVSSLDFVSTEGETVGSFLGRLFHHI